MRLAPGHYTGDLRPTNSGGDGSGGRINIIGDTDSTTGTSPNNYTFSGDVNLEQRSYITVRGIMALGGGVNWMNIDAVRDSITNCYLIGGIYMYQRSHYSVLDSSRVGDGSGTKIWYMKGTNYSADRARGMRITNNLFRLRGVCQPHIMDWASLDSTIISRNVIYAESAGFAGCTGGGAARFSLRFSLNSTQSSDNKYILTSNATDGVAATLFYYRDANTHFNSHVRDTVIELSSGINTANVVLAGTGNGEGQVGTTFTDCVIVVRGDITVQNAQSSQMVLSGNILASRGIPFHISDVAACFDSITLTHNTIVSLNGSNVLRKESAGGWLYSPPRGALVKNNVLYKVGDATNLWYNQGGVWTKLASETYMAKDNLWFGSSGSSISNAIRWEVPGCTTCGSACGSGSVNYYTPSGSPATSNTLYGNPVFACTVIGSSSFTTAAQYDTVVAWIQRGSNPFALGAGSNAVNHVRFDQSTWTWPDGYVGAIAPGGTASGKLFASTTGSGTDCTYASPCNIDTLMSRAAAGDTARILAGTYTGKKLVPVRTGTAEKPIVFIGGGPWASSTRVDSIIIKTSHVIVDSMAATHAEILELSSASPVQYSKLRYGAYGRLWISGASHSLALDDSISGPVRVLGDWRSQTARNGEAFRDTLRRLHIRDTLSTSAPRLFDVRYARDCLFDSLNTLGLIDATVDSVMVRRFALSEDCEWIDNRWRFAASGAGAVSFSLVDSTRSNMFLRETWEADSTGTYTVSAYLTNNSGTSGVNYNTYRDCSIISTGTNYLAGTNESTIIDSTLLYSRLGTGLRMTGATWGSDIQFNTIRGAREALYADTDLWHGSLLLSNVFVADTLADSSSAVLIYRRESLRPIIWNFNLYFANRTRAATIIDASRHAVRVIGLEDSTLGVGGFTSYLDPNHCIQPWGVEYMDCASAWGTPAFDDSTFATFSGAPSTGSAAKRPDWPQGYSGAFAPETDVTAPDAVADLDGLVNPGGVSVTLTWTEVGDDGSTGRAYIAYIAHEQRLTGQPSLLSSSTFEEYRSPVQLQPLALPTVMETVVMPIGNYNASAQNYYMVKICDGAENCSYSNVLGPL